MASSVYRKLALTSMKHNRKTYVPYLLTALLTVGMFYIMDALSKNESMLGIGVALEQILGMAVGVILIFAVIFLFYTNSFLIKRRKKELGLYNILGMGKQHIARMLLIETLVTAAASLAGGILGGIAFGKLMYLILLKILHYDTGMKFEWSVPAAADTMLCFGMIFLLILAYNLFQIRLANPIELLHGSSEGEREPKTKWLLTLFGLVMVGIGYYIALTTEAPLQALFLFFVAVICVILGTYALFVAGSVALLKLLKKNKNFYYKTRHFTTVSGMIYRMKQNAVGLANICILSTMVLVMISTTISMYMGMEDILDTRFPREYMLTNYTSMESEEQALDQMVEAETKDANVTRENEIRFHSGTLAAVRKGADFDIYLNGSYGMDADGACQIFLVPLEDYNQMTGRRLTLAQNEALISGVSGRYGETDLSLGEYHYQVKEDLKTFPVTSTVNKHVLDTYYVVLADTQQIEEILEAVMGESSLADQEAVDRLGALSYHIQFDLSGDKEVKTKVEQAMNERAKEISPAVDCESRELSQKSFYELYGGLFFLGLYLGILFLMATVLIIYYKQISEGYEDKERYQIMQKVGMSKREVKASIRSQVLMVFFLPLLMAIVHIAAAFRVTTKLLEVFNMTNISLFMGCVAATTAVFAVFYAIVYAITAREYYKIVNERV